MAIDDSQADLGEFGTGTRPVALQLYDELGVGRENGRFSGELAATVGIKDSAAWPSTRELLRSLTYDHDVPIAATTSDGYFIIETAREHRDYQATLEARIQGIEKRKRAVAEAWQNWNDD